MPVHIDKVGIVLLPAVLTAVLTPFVFVVWHARLRIPLKRPRSYSTCADRRAGALRDYEFNDG
jgi:hypothetical protein